MSDLLEVLRSLPPELAQPADRYDRVRARVAKRRKRVVVGSGACVAAAVVAIAGVALGLVDPTTRASQVATDPNTTIEQTDAKVLPGGTRVVELDAPLITKVTGEGTVALGTRTPETNAVTLSIWCLSGGTLRMPFPGGGSIKCGAEEAVSADDRPISAGNIIKLEPGVDSLKFKASQGSQWQVETTYVRAVQTPWGVNANGDTYGVTNDDGDPDLVAVQATNGRSGYAYATEIEGPTPTSPAEALAQQEANEGKSRSIPVYESDGETVIGEFVMGPGVGRSFSR